MDIMCVISAYLGSIVEEDVEDILKVIDVAEELHSVWEGGVVFLRKIVSYVARYSPLSRSPRSFQIASARAVGKCQDQSLGSLRNSPPAPTSVTARLGSRRPAATRANIWEVMASPSRALARSYATLNNVTRSTRRYSATSTNPTPLTSLKPNR